MKKSAYDYIKEFLKIAFCKSSCNLTLREEMSINRVKWRKGFMHQPQNLAKALLLMLLWSQANFTGALGFQGSTYRIQGAGLNRRKRGGKAKQ